MRIIKKYKFVLIGILVLFLIGSTVFVTIVRSGDLKEFQNNPAGFLSLDELTVPEIKDVPFGDRIRLENEKTISGKRVSSSLYGSEKHEKFDEYLVRVYIYNRILSVPIRQTFLDIVQPWETKPYSIRTEEFYQSNRESINFGFDMARALFEHEDLGFDNFSLTESSYAGVNNFLYGGWDVELAFNSSMMAGIDGNFTNKSDLELKMIYSERYLLDYEVVQVFRKEYKRVPRHNKFLFDATTYYDYEDLGYYSLVEEFNTFGISHLQTPPSLLMSMDLYREINGKDIYSYYPIFGDFINV